MTPVAAPARALTGDHDGHTLPAVRAGDHDGDTRPHPSGRRGLRRPVEGRMVLPTGEVVAIDAPVVVGRLPRSGAMRGARLVAVPSPTGEISRNHLAVLPVGDGVVVADLASTNGTVLIRPVGAPESLPPHERTAVASGDIVDLGDGAAIRFEGLT